MTCCGRSVAAASKLGMKVEVLLARMACGGVQASMSRKQGSLDLQVFGNRLDDQVGIGDGRAKIATHGDAHGGGGRFSGRDALDLDQAGQAIRNAVPGSVELRLIPVVQLDGEAVSGELEGDTVSHQTGPDHGYALDVVCAHGRSPPLRCAASHAAADGTSFLCRDSEKPALRRRFVLRGQFAGISILTLRQRLCRIRVSH